ncbi:MULTISPECIES: SDR family NAD(P)-dependent oxidoreductase [Halomonas]|uniref:3-ketoacyl-ACP reductase n=1 Tax=Halomonas halophila TaxID=29573 RepID=A0ABQ0U7H6_9GAMM|nr:MULTISPECIES: SDR family NAD(P)-dependent oxidoreductase [Halomonas]MDR5890626.1 SDR family NAD(P)-dependent oxidoreductase [Halomonas salina]WJY06011.1 SDR family NAD(P)-dependent oxidoreductase [Halomonas halophila]GEK74335.1 3-ketoacyl-ACP reductase [Halomonas halophila]
MTLQDRIIAITGGARGLGLAMAERLGREGATVALLDRDGDSLDAAVSRLAEANIMARGFVVDVADEASVAEAFTAVGESLGPLDGLVNNAGIVRDGLLVKARDGEVSTRLSLSDWQRVIDVNLTGVFLCGREAATRMIEAGRQGVIVNISSVVRGGNVGQSNYAAAKAGVASLTVTWAQELSRYGIRVGAVAPGFIETEMTAELREDIRDRIASQIPLLHMGQPGDIAESVAFIFANDYFTGRVLECDGGLRI